jgi:hypothetical protein
MEVALTPQQRQAAKQEIVRQFEHGVSVEDVRGRSPVPMHRTTIYRLCHLPQFHPTQFPFPCQGVQRSADACCSPCWSWARLEYLAHGICAAIPLTAWHCSQDGREPMAIATRKPFCRRRPVPMAPNAGPLPLRAGPLTSGMRQPKEAKTQEEWKEQNSRTR